MSALTGPRAPKAAPAVTLSAGPAGFTWNKAQADARASALSRHPVGLLAGAVGMADATVIVSTSVVAYLLRHGLTPIAAEVVTTTLLAVMLVVNGLRFTGAYTTHLMSGFAVQARRVAQAWTAAFVVLLILGYLSKTSDDYSRVWAVLWYGAALAGLLGVRLVAVSRTRRLRRRGELARTVAIVDLDGTGEELARRLLRRKPNEIRLAGVFSLVPAPRRTSGIDDLIALSRLFRIDEVLVAAVGTADDAVSAVLRRLGTIPTNVRLCALLPDVVAASGPRGEMLLELPVLTIHRRPLGDWSSLIKRLEDVVLGSLLLLALGPVMLIAAIAVKFDSPGPIFFRQARLGFNNNVISVYKFRSMYHRPADDKDVRQARRHDKRVTRVGRFLRRTSLDELPQIFNVLRGDMSLVGPRPHAVAHNDEYAALIDDYLGRHRVQPGITGLAQVNGFRGETDTLDKMQRRVEYDLAYISRWSILLDLKIICLTAMTVAFDRQAY